MTTNEEIYPEKSLHTRSIFEFPDTPNSEKERNTRSIAIINNENEEVMITVTIENTPNHPADIANTLEKNDSNSPKKTKSNDQSTPKAADPSTPIKSKVVHSSQKTSRPLSYPSPSYSPSSSLKSTSITNSPIQSLRKSPMSKLINTKSSLPAKSSATNSPRTISETPKLDSSTSKSKESSPKSNNPQRAKALEDSMAAAKKKLEARAKALKEERERERIALEQKEVAKAKFARTPLPTTSEGFFSAQMMKSLLPEKKEDRPLTPPPPTTTQSSSPSSSSSQMESKVPELSPEEIAAMKVEEEKRLAEKEKRLRAKALSASLAAAKAKYDATPKGKIALAKAQRLEAKKNKLLKIEQSIEVELEISVENNIDNEDPVEEIEEWKPKELTEEEKAQILEEASYVSVDVAYASSRLQESKEIFEKVLFKRDEAMVWMENITNLAVSISSDYEDLVVGLTLKAHEQLQTIMETVDDASLLIDEIESVYKQAEIESSSIMISKTLDEAMNHVENASVFSETASIKVSGMNSLYKSICDFIQEIQYIKNQLTEISHQIIEEKEEEEENGVVRIVLSDLLNFIENNAIDT